MKYIQYKWSINSSLCVWPIIYRPKSWSDKDFLVQSARLIVRFLPRLHLYLTLFCSTILNWLVKLISLSYVPFSILIITQSLRSFFITIYLLFLVFFGCSGHEAIVFVPLVARMASLLLQEGQALHLPSRDYLMVNLLLVVVQRAQIRILALDIVVRLGRRHVITKPRWNHLHAPPCRPLRDRVKRESGPDVERAIAIEAGLVQHLLLLKLKKLLLGSGDEDLATLFLGEVGRSYQVELDARVNTTTHLQQLVLMPHRRRHATPGWNVIQDQLVVVIAMRLMPSGRIGLRVKAHHLYVIFILIVILQ